MALKKSEQLAFLKASKVIIKNRQKRGVCEALSLKSRESSDYWCYTTMAERFHLLTFENAQKACRIKHVKMPKIEGPGYWWAYGNLTSRFAFINWMIEEIEMEIEKIEVEIKNEKEKYLYEKFLKKVAASTNNNFHDEARILIAKHFGFDSQLVELQRIQAVHERIGFITYEQIIERTAITKQMMNLIVAKFHSEEIMKEVYSKL